MFVCLCVTKNHHFLLGVSCNHLNHPSVQLKVSFHGFSQLPIGISWFQVYFYGFSCFQVGFSWFQVGFIIFHCSRLVFHGSRSVFIVIRGSGKAQHLPLPFQGDDGKQLFFGNIEFLPPKNDFAKETKTKTKHLKPFI